MRRSALALVLAVSLAGCDERPLDHARADAGPPPGGLTPEQAALVLARVGERTITLGDFTAALERMNSLDRPRYLNPEMRRKLLQELIDIELLAQEARRRGLDKRPEVEEAMRQILREAALVRARAGLPAPAEIPIDRVREYYEKNKESFREPERRRVAAIVLGDPDKAKDVLEKALKAHEAGSPRTPEPRTPEPRTPGRGERWGELFFEHSLTAPKDRSGTPADLVGDLGFVGPPGDPKGASTTVPAAVQRAAFELGKVGDVHHEVVEDGGKYYVVRLSGKTPGHTRSLAEAERVIRSQILEELRAERERELEAKLRERFPVVVDAQALAQVKLPPALEGSTLWQEPPIGAASAASSSP